MNKELHVKKDHNFTNLKKKKVKFPLFLWLGGKSRW